jgi:hypothetical protein
VIIVLHLIGKTFVGGVAGALLVLLGVAVFVEYFQSRIFPPKPGQGFNALGLVLYLLGPPSGAVIGATAGLVWSLYRWKGPGTAPARMFAQMFRGLAVVCVLLLVTLRFSADGVKPVGWLILGGFTANAAVGAFACYWVARRSDRYAAPAADAEGSKAP